MSICEWGRSEQVLCWGARLFFEKSRICSDIRIRWKDIKTRMIYLCLLVCVSITAAGFWTSCIEGWVWSLNNRKIHYIAVQSHWCMEAISLTLSSLLFLRSLIRTCCSITAPASMLLRELNIYTIIVTLQQHVGLWLVKKNGSQFSLLFQTIPIATYKHSPDLTDFRNVKTKCLLRFVSKSTFILSV